MSDYPMLISNKLHSFRNFFMQRYTIIEKIKNKERKITSLSNSTLHPYTP